MNADLVAYCDQVRAEHGLPDDILFRILEDMGAALVRVRGWAPATRERNGIPEEMIA